MKSPIRILAILPVVALAACSGNTVVTLTATPATALAASASAASGFLAYRVKLVSITVNESKGGASVSILPHPVTIDLAQVTSLSEILTDAALKKGDYTSVTLALDYTDAVIVADNGSAAGLTLTPQTADGKAAGQVTLTLALDPSNPLSISTGSTSQLALDFRLASSNLVDPTTRAVTVTPAVVASSAAIDAKTVRLRGYLKKVDNSASAYSAGIEPADGLATEGGSIGVAPSATTAYEVNGIAATGSTTGFAALSALSPGAWTIAYGTLTTSTSTRTTGTGTTTTNSGGLLGAGTTGTATTSTQVTNLSFTPTQVLAGSSVQAGGFDVVSGVVTARTGNVLTVPTATWISNGGIPTFVVGTATITVGSNTAIFVPPVAATTTTLGNTNTEARISVGSTITAYGTTTSNAGGNLSLDVTNGRVRIGNSVASGTVQGTGSAEELVLSLTALAGRQVAGFNFANTAASPSSYLVNTTTLDFSGYVGNDPLQLTGTVAGFAATSSDFTATAVHTASTITAELVLDWSGAGAVTPFVISSTELDLPVSAASAGTRHQVAVGPDIYQLTTLTSDLVIVPSSASTLLYSIAHASTSRVENFNSFAAFTKALAAELDGKTAATSITAEGVYAASGTTFTATGIIVSLNI